MNVMDHLSFDVSVDNVTSTEPTIPIPSNEDRTASGSALTVISPVLWPPTASSASSCGSQSYRLNLDFSGIDTVDDCVSALDASSPINSNFNSG